MISGLLFDYGGTIDTNGLHWAVVLKNSYEKHNINIPVDLFSKAYSHGERSLALKPLVKPNHTFLDVLKLKIRLQIEFINESGFYVDYSNIDLIANNCNDFALSNILPAKKVLTELREVYPIVMVSNFYGNLNAVLEEFDIRSLFDEIIESAVVGFRKPDPQIYQLGVKALGFAAKDCMVVGDSFTKDILPAKEIGCSTIWLKKEGWADDSDKEKLSAIKSDIEINEFQDIRRYLLPLSY